MDSSRIRILHVYRTYFPDPPGGLQQAIRQICLTTARYNTECCIFTLSPSPKPNSIPLEEGRVIRARSLAEPASCSIGGADAFYKFRKLANWADLIHYHFPWPFADLLRFTAPNRASIITYHSDVVRQRLLKFFYAPLMRHTLMKMDAVVATSAAYAKTSPVLRHIPNDKLRIIPLGMVDSLSYKPDNESDILKRLNLNKNGYFLALGVLRYYKGFHYLIKAASQVKAKIVIAGSGPQGRILETMVANEAGENVILSGQVSEEEKHTLIKDCLAMVLPSCQRSEAFGMVLVEAAMYEKPMISCEIGTGTSYINLNGVTGYVVNPAAPEELGRAMNMMFSDCELSVSMGRNARKRYEELFSGEALGKSYNSLYREIIDRRSFGEK